MKFPIENGANIKAKNNAVLMIASYHGHLDIVKFLIKNGADVKNPMNLVQAAAARNEEALKILIDNGADVNAKIDGKSVLTIVQESRSYWFDMVDFLIEAGAK